MTTGSSTNDSLENCQQCRTCVKGKSVKSLNESVICESKQISISDMLYSVASIQVALHDGYPQGICETCENLAMVAYKFRLTCQRADKVWKFRSIKSSDDASDNIRSDSHTDYSKLETEYKESFSYSSMQNSTSNHDLEINFENENNPEGDFSLSDTQVKNGESEHSENVTDMLHYKCKNVRDKNLCQDTNFRNNNEKIDSQCGTCPLCGDQFENINHLEEHIKSHTMQCLNCNSKFRTIIGLKKHLKKHSSEETSSNKQLLAYFKIVSRLGKTCKKCGKEFQHRSSMLKHLKKHTLSPKVCEFCDFVPTDHSKMAQHMEEKHSHLKNISCKVCGKMFFKESNLRLHMKLHSGMKKHICEMCGMSFSLACNLIVHRRLHTGEKPYTCSVCSREFTQHSALKSHEACHSDKRDYKCNDCDAAFSRPGALRNHRKRHSSSKPFVCSFCGIAFTFSSERKRHMTIHTGDKKHICDVCGHRFNRSTNLRVHYRIHTGETPYVCKLCGKGFIQSYCLKAHSKVHAVGNVNNKD